MVQILLQDLHNGPARNLDARHPDPRLAAAVVDRLTFNAHIINTGTQSYRLAHTRKETTAN